MGHSSLLGTESPQRQSPGRDTAALGPGDSSDTGSDMAGLESWLDGGDPTEPVDVALRPDGQRSALPADVLDGGSSDTAGTGERRSAGSDAGGRDANDVSVDHIFDPGDPLSELPLDDLADVDQAQVPLPLAPEEDESADPVGDGHSDAEMAEKERRKAQPRSSLD